MDLKTQFESIITNYGHPAIYRRYNPGVKSQFYSKTTREGVGGHKWTYTDSNTEVRDSAVGNTGSKGEYGDMVVYYLKAEVNPKVNDVIIEHNSGKHLVAYKIEDIKTERGCEGGVVYYACYVKPEYGYY